MLRELGGRVMLAGRCSGAYLAIRHAALDDRLKAVVSINPFVLYWDPKQQVDALLRVVPRSLDDYGQRLARLDTVKRLFRGEIDVPAAGKNVLIAVGKRVARRASPLVRLLPGRRHVHREVRDTFRTFRSRKLPVSLIYSEGDVGVDDLNLHFGDRAVGLRSYSNVRLTMLPDTDHNVTPPASRRIVFDEILRLARA